MLRIVKLHIKPNKTDEFINVFEAHRPRLRKMPGCKSVTLARDQKNDHQFVTISEWTHNKYLENYRHSTLFLEVWQKVKPLFHAKAQVQSLEILSSEIFKIST